MPFKIVQTNEDGEQCLTVVPSGWEREGILSWPKTTGAAKLAKNANSLPTLKWHRILCSNKRENSFFSVFLTTKGNKQNISTLFASSLIYLIPTMELL